MKIGTRSGIAEKDKMTTVGTHVLKINPESSPYFFGTTHVGNPASSEAVHILLAGHSWDNVWQLAATLLVEVHTFRDVVKAVTYLTVEEYGIGATVEEAILDLLTSLSDYLQSLEERRERLGQSALEDLDKLRKLVRSTSSH